MCGYKNMFTELDESVNRHVSFGDSSKVDVKGKDKIFIQLKDGSHKFISNIYYIPEMKNNILSLGQLLEKGYDMHMKNRSLFLRDQKNNLIVHVQMTKNRTFMLNIKHVDTKCLNASVKDCLWLWDLRFDHLHFGGLKQLSSKKMVKGLPHIDSLE